MSPYIDTAVLLQTRNIAHALARLVSPRLQPNADEKLDALPPSHLTLALPEPLAPQLLARGVDQSSADRISTTVTKLTLRLKANCEADFKHRREALRPTLHQYQDPKLSFLIRAYLAIFSRTCHNWSNYILQDFTPRFLKAQAVYKVRRSQSPSCVGRRSFNQAAIPVLEQFFEANAFPSRLEKDELASQCDMEFRQIHVWFQNRRSRFRKEGKELKKPHSSVLSQELENSVIDVLLPLDSSEEFDVQGSSSGDHDASFDLRSPAHAFPCPYPPQCPYNPFPERHIFETHWPRVHDSSRSSSRADIDVHDLVASFANLSIAEECSPLEERCKASHGCSAQDQLPYVVMCMRAPHPALVRRPRVDQSHLFPPSSLPRSTCDGTGRGHASRDGPSTIPVEGLSGPPTIRSRRRLPRRFPKHPLPLPSIPKCGSTLSFDSSPTLPSRTASRASSVCSLSSEGSTGSEPLLSTPPSSPLSRPRAVLPCPLLGQELDANTLPVEDQADVVSLDILRWDVALTDVKGLTSADSSEVFCKTESIPPKYTFMIDFLYPQLL